MHDVDKLIVVVAGKHDDYEIDKKNIKLL